MRTALLSWETLHSIPVGGVAAHVTELAAALERRGHEVHVFTRRGPNQSEYANIDGVHYHLCNCPGHHDFVAEIEIMCQVFMDAVASTERFLGAAFDVVHAHDWLCAPAIRQVREQGRGPSVFTLHSTEFGRCGNEHRGGMSDRISHLEWLGTNHSDRCICVSGVLRQEAMRLYQLSPETSRVIYNGVSAHQFDDENLDIGEFKQRQGIGPMDPTVLFCGRLTTQKGPDLLLECVPGMVKHHPAVKFLYVGTGDMENQLRGRADHLGVSHAVRFLGYRSGKELANLFRCADIVAVPSRNEPFGIVILEAWASGKPTVATRNGGPAEFVVHGHDGVMTIDHPDSIGWGVGTLLNDLGRARWMGDNGKRKATTTFSWDNIARQTEEIYAMAGN